MTISIGWTAIITRGTPADVTRVITQGVDLGFFERRGISLQISTTQASEPQMQDLLDRRFDIASSDADNFIYCQLFVGADVLRRKMGREHDNFSGVIARSKSPDQLQPAGPGHSGQVGSTRTPAPKGDQGTGSSSAPHAGVGQGRVVLGGQDRPARRAKIGSAKPNAAQPGQGDHAPRSRETDAASVRSRPLRSSHRSSS